ncbi:alpha-hydroxy acid oxidase [Variibacter gotjawalensis]|nr:alpha-hydroxy acid oxidase [Variibacter gotjawalensis]
MPTGVPRRIRNVLSLLDFEEEARKFLPRPIFGFISGAAEENAALSDNRGAFAEYGFVPRVLNNVSQRSMATKLFGQTFSAPFGIAPMGMSALCAYRGDLVLTQAARAANVPMIMSGSSLIRLEEVIAANPDAWFQAYLPGDETRIEELVHRVQNAGFKTLLLTVDVTVHANRENNIRAGFTTPLKPSLQLMLDGLSRPGWLTGVAAKTVFKHGMPHFENSFATRGAPIIAKTVMRDFGARDHLNWEHLALMRRLFKGRLIVKGLMHPDDARKAREHGVDGVIVSNHGGRQLDYTVSPLRTLKEIADNAGDMTVMFDSGIRRGTDVLKAIALGAKFVFVGRPFLYAASIAGEAGAAHAIKILKEEVLRDMGLLGINSLDEMTPDLMRRVSGIA